MSIRGCGFSAKNGQKIVFMEDKFEEMTEATGKTSVEVESLQTNVAALVEEQAGANSSIAANQQNILTLEQDSNIIKTRVSDLECRNRPCKNGAACLSLPEGFQCDCAGTGYKVGSTFLLSGAECNTRVVYLARVV